MGDYDHMDHANHPRCKNWTLPPSTTLDALLDEKGGGGIPKTYLWYFHYDGKF